MYCRLSRELFESQKIRGRSNDFDLDFLEATLLNNSIISARDLGVDHTAIQCHLNDLRKVDVQNRMAEYR